MHKTSLFASIIALCLSSVLAAAPRLTVFVLVDGITETNMQQLRPYWSQGGLRTLSEEGFKTALSYPHLLFGGDETTATLMTGATPLKSGYTTDYTFNRSDRTAHLFLEDKQVEGIGTDLQLSPQALLTTTLADRLRLHYPDAKIYAIGLRPTTTVLMAGHGADACCWLDGTTKRWVTSAYYRLGLPAEADSENMTGRIDDICTRTWIPSMSVSSYLHPTAEEKKKGFSYDAGSYLLHTPYANTLAIELALNIQQKQHLGTDATPDLLLLHLTTLSPQACSDAIETAEQEDMYISLNRDLGWLMEQLDRRIGRTNYQIAVIGLPRLGGSSKALEQLHMSSQEFNTERAAALLNTYLMAFYGHERWVDGYCGSAIFFNRTLMEQKRLDLTTVQRQAANFLMEFAGVEMAYIPADIIVQPRLLASFNKRNMGDVIFTLEPFWHLTPTKTQGLYIDEEPTTSPLLYRPAGTKHYPAESLQATELNSLLEL